MQLRKVKINESVVITILCQRSYQTLLEKLRLKYDHWELFNAVNPACGKSKLQIIGIQKRLQRYKQN